MGTSLLTKSRLLEKQLFENDLQFVAVQEGRAKTRGIREGTSYTMYRAAATQQGALGTQIWVRKSVVGFVAVQWWKPISERVVIVFGSYLKVGIAFIAAHAPHSGYSEASRRQFWDNLCVLVDAVRKDHPNHAIIVAMDANASVGSVSSPSLVITNVIVKTAMVHA